MSASIVPAEAKSLAC